MKIFMDDDCFNALKTKVQSEGKYGQSHIRELLMDRCGHPIDTKAIDRHIIESVELKLN